MDSIRRVDRPLNDPAATGSKPRQLWPAEIPVEAEQLHERSAAASKTAAEVGNWLASASAAGVPERTGNFIRQAVPRLVVGSGIEFHERGEYELKGVPGTWKVFSVEP